MRLKFLLSAAALALLATSSAPYAATGKSEPAFRASSLSGAYLAARIAETDNDLPAAIAYYERALSFDPLDVSLKQSLLVALIANGDFDRALPYADQLKTVADIERFSRVALAIDAFRKKDFASAENLLKLALETDLDRLVTGLMTAWAKVGAGDAKAGLAHAETLKGPVWFDLFLAYHKALIAEKAGDEKQALAAFDRVLNNPAAAASAPEAFLRSAEAHAGYLARLGRKDEALKVLDRATELYAGRIQIDALRKRIEAGQEVRPLVPAAADGASEVLLNLGSALNRGGGESFVRLYLQLALALRPSSDSALVQLAGVAEQMNDSLQAIALYERVKKDSPVYRVAQMQMGLNLADLDRNDEAIVHLKNVLAADPTDMRGYLAMGGVYSSEKKFREAADIYDRAAAIIGQGTQADWNIFYQRGIAYERLKEWPKAEPNFLRALELYPDHPQVLNYLGYSWVDMNLKLEEGLDLIQKAVDLRPSDGYIVDSLGWAFYKLGRNDDAVRELERAVGLMPGDPILNDHLGDAYWKVGRKLEARFQWTHARDLKPEPDVLAQVLDKLVNGLPDDKHPTVAEEPKPSQQDMTVPLPNGGQRSDAAPQEPARVTADAATHIVLPGQSLWSIAAEKLGDGKRFRELLDLNPELRGDPGRIVPGQSLKLPGPAN
ncbi:MAG: tetratricopeptide repeat protein [Rhizobiaceae bacterium]|nr:tetratricopeptide repeat protein [Rhizobiaceae bacterium]